MNIPLEYRISYAHVGKDMIEIPNVVIHTHNPYWSYARHLPNNWDFSKNDRRKSVAFQLLKNLEHLSEGQEIDLTPLKDDQRVSGIVYGDNPLQNMFNIINKYSKLFPNHEFHAKWGGSHFKIPGKGFAFYVDDEKDAQESIQRLNATARDIGISIDAYHRYGIVGYQKFVNIDDKLKSKIRDIEGFRELLHKIKESPHFFHELFFDREVYKKVE